MYSLSSHCQAIAAGKSWKRKSELAKRSSITSAGIQLLLRSRIGTMSLVSASSERTPEKPPNKVHQSDVENAVKYSRWFLQSLGVWPMISHKSSMMEKYVSKCLILICLIGIVFPVVPSVFHTILRKNSQMVKLMRLGPIGSCLSSLFKYVFIVYHCNTIRLCVEHMESDWMMVERQSERAIMIRNVRVGRGLTVICCVFMYTGGLFYNVLMPLLKGTMKNERNETVRPLTYAGFDVFVDPQRSPTYEIIFCSTCAASIIRYTVNIAVCNLAAVFVTHACGQIQIVVSRLGSFVDGDDDDEKCNSVKLQKRLSSIVQCHTRGLSLSSRINEFLQEICLIEIVAATFIICLLEYHCMMEWNNSDTVAIITYFVFLLSYIFNIFIFCYIGELLTEQCYGIGKSTYLIDWYKLPGKTGFAIIMIIAMASYSRKITAGGMFDLSLVSFGMIIRTTITYLNMIRAMTN